MNTKDRIRERIREGRIRDPVFNKSDDPAIYHAMRPDGKPLNVAYYRHMRGDLLDISVYHELELHCAKQWIGVRTDWDLKAVFLDAAPCWDSFNEMKAGNYDLIVSRTISCFGNQFSLAAERIASLTCPVYFEADRLMTTDENYPAVIEMLITEEKQRTALLHHAKEYSEGVATA